MFEVELDVYSGVDNPRWVLDEKQESELLDRVVADPLQMSPTASSEVSFGLGYRGMILRQIKNDGPWARAKLSNGLALPNEFRVGVKRMDQAKSTEWLLKTSEKAASGVDNEVNDVLREVASGGLSVVLSDQVMHDPEVGEPSSSADTSTTNSDLERAPIALDKTDASDKSEILGSTWWACNSNYFCANASYFNLDAYRLRNNCYCFAANHLANVRGARPGRRARRPDVNPINGQNIVQGLYADGWRDGCQPRGLTIACVIWPGRDYHFFRLVTGGRAWWWGHKPGATKAVYSDNSGRALANGLSPRNCNRGPYTQFWGFFYQDNATAFVA